MANPQKIGAAPSPKLSVDATMEILRTSVPQLVELTRGAPPRHLDTATAYGWTVNEQLAHLRAVQDVLGGNMIRIVSEEHPAWRATSPRSGQERHFGVPWHEALAAFRTQRTELLAVLEPLPAEAWNRTATVTAPPNTVYEYSTHYYGDWLARHERSHLRHMARILGELLDDG